MKVNNLVVFSIFPEPCNHHHDRPENILLTPERNPLRISSLHTISLQHPQPLATTNLLPVYVDLPSPAIRG